MRAFTAREMGNLYRLTKGSFIVGGMLLISYGALGLAEAFAARAGVQVSWFGIFPVYVGAMLILFAAAMKEDWFTNARRYW